MTLQKALFYVGFACGGAVLQSQDFHADSRLILVPVTVTDRHGANIVGLTKENFTVFDDRLPQPISTFYREDAPCTVGLVMDVSGSVRNRLNWEKEAVHSLLNFANADDEYFVTSVSSTPSTILPPGDDVGALGERIAFMRGGGATALFDGIHLAAMQLMRSRRPCRALVVLSDGIDNHSRSTRSGLLTFLVEADVQVYTIGINSPVANRKGIEVQEDQRGMAFLDEIAGRTGGFSARAPSTEDPSKSALKIATAMRNRYVLGFRPADESTDGKWHRIQVKIDRSKVNVFARSGYRLSSGLQ